jgi:hypothetical protein
MSGSLAGSNETCDTVDNENLTGPKAVAACWRADGAPIGIAGGLARAGVRFGLR